MLTIFSFLQGIYRFIKKMAVTVTKKMYRTAAVFVSMAAVVTVITLTSSGFGTGGRSVISAYAETVTQSLEEDEEETAPEEMNMITEAKIRVELTDSDSRRDGQLFAGSILERDVRKKQAMDELMKAQAEETKLEFVRQEEERARQEAEAARLQAEEEARKNAARTSLSEEDYNVLLKIVQAEAGICDEKGRILVANVILNRVRSSEFPNSVTAVVYQPSQFSPVSNGNINRVKVTEETKQCVDRALAGEDYSQGALYFMNRGRSRSGAVKWFDSRLTYLFEHDRHQFYR